MTQNIPPGIDEGQSMNDNFKRIGKQLQVARKERAMRLADVARELRISADYLKLLESGDFDQLPPQHMYPAFCEAMANFLGWTGLTFRVGSMRSRALPQRKWIINCQ